MITRREPTPAEAAWWRRLTWCLREMPATMEVLVGARGDMVAAARGRFDATFRTLGNADNVPTLDLPNPAGVKNNEGSL